MNPLPEPSDGDQNRAPALLAIFWAPFPVTVALIGARLFVRLRLKSLGLDDYTMFLVWLLYVVSLSLASACMTNGGARHSYYLIAHPDQVTTVLKFNFASQPFGAMAAAIGKSSVAFIILRIIGPKTFWRKWFIYGNLMLYMIITILSTILTFAQCKPTKGLWEPAVQPRCWNPNISVVTTILQSAYGTFLDFTLALLPITIIWKLNMSYQKKSAICFLLGLGIFAGICAAIKTSHLQSYGSRADFTWATFEIFAWSALEISFIIICGCIPTIKPILDHFLKGTPVRPFRSNGHPSKRSYEMHSSNSASRKGNLVSTNITSSSDCDSRTVYRADPKYDTRDIHVEHNVEIDHYDRDSIRQLRLRDDDFA